MEDLITWEDDDSYETPGEPTPGEGTDSGGVERMPSQDDGGLISLLPSDYDVTMQQH
jgi:hypothetical protein